MNNKNYNKSVLIIANSYLEYKFSIRLSEGLSKIGYRICVLSLKPSILIRLRRKKVDSLLIKRSKNIIEVPNLGKIEKVCNYIYTKEEIAQLYVSIFDYVQKLLNENLIDIILIWNGHGATSLPLHDVAKKNNIHTVYLELANLPGKIFADPIGVNAASSLFENINLLKKYPSNESLYLEWKEEYVKYKSSNPIVPQADKLYKKNNLLFIIDYLSCRFRITPVSGDYILFRKFRTKFMENHFQYYTDKSIHHNAYLFLPLQMGNDTQLVFNSDVNNIEAIKIGFERAKQKGLDLIVKPHPASLNKKEMEEILSLKQKLNFILTSKNSFDLIIDAEEIITINSTLGLDALILGKHVTFLGKSFYSLLNQEYLRNYILSYLINIDYFGNDQVDTIELKKLIHRKII